MLFFCAELSGSEMLRQAEEDVCQNSNKEGGNLFSLSSHHDTRPKTGRLEMQGPPTHDARMPRCTRLSGIPETAVR